MVDDQARRFYDELAPDYHLIFPDWDASIRRQGKALGRLVREAIGAGRCAVLDCACGIGTQLIGLAQLGHQVTGSDLSAVAAGRAAAEARSRGLEVPALAADMRGLPFRAASFDVVVCADNSVAHLLTEENLAVALNSMRRVLRPGGLLVLTVRSDDVRKTHPTTTPVQVTETPVGPVLTVQLWDWHADGEHYDMRHVQLVPTEAGYEARVRQAVSWAISRLQLSAAVLEAGFIDATWYLPKESGYFQPVLISRAPSR